MVNLKKVLKGAAIAGTVATMFVLAGCTQKISQEDANVLVEKAKADAYESGKSSVDVNKAVADALNEYKSEQPVINNTPVVFNTAVAVNVECDPYMIDGLQLGNSVGVKLDDTDFCKLNEETVELNDKEYTFREYVDLTSDVKIAYSGGPYDSELGNQVALELDRSGSVRYYKEAESNLDWSKINSEDSLVLTFLGKTMNIVSTDANANSITVLDGDEVYLKTGQEALGVKLEFVGSNNALVSVNGISESIRSGQTKTINGKRIKLETFASESNDLNSGALLIVGSNADRVFEDGDAYIGEDKNNPEWEWSIDLSKGLIGVKHAKSLTEADEVYKVGDSLQLPNDFMQVGFVKLSNEKTENYEIGFDTIDINNMPVKALMFEGKMEYGASSLRTNKVALFNNTFYVEDGTPKRWVPTWKVNFEVNHLPVIAANSYIEFDNVRVGLDYANEKFISSYYRNIDLSSRETDVLTQSGFVIKNPETNFEKSRSVMVINAMPNKQLEFGLKVEGTKVV